MSSHSPVWSYNSDIESEESGDTRQSIEERLVKEYRKSDYAQETKAELERIIRGKAYSTKPKSRTITYNCSFFHQLNWVTKRTFRNLMLNPQTSIAQVWTFIMLIAKSMLTLLHIRGATVRVANLGPKAASTFIFKGISLRCQLHSKNWFS